MGTDKNQMDVVLVHAALSATKHMHAATNSVSAVTLAEKLRILDYDVVTVKCLMKLNNVFEFPKALFLCSYVI